MDRATDLIRQWRETGDRRFRDQVVEENKRLAYSIARSASYSSGMDVEDLAQEGIIGLLNAVDKFNTELGYKFSTYATYLIRQAVNRARENLSRAIRIPTHAFYKDIEHPHVAFSLDHFYSDGEGATYSMEEVFPTENTRDEETIEMRIVIEDLLRVLSPKEQELIRLKYWEEMDYKTLTEALSKTRKKGTKPYSRQHLRRMEVRALDKLRKAALESLEREKSVVNADILEILLK